MSKSILVIDKADKCSQCPFSGCDGDYCCMKDEPISYEQYSEEKPDWCPLRDFPQKRDLKDIEKHEGLGTDYVWSEGYNACIDEILAEKFHR